LVTEASYNLRLFHQNAKFSEADLAKAVIWNADLRKTDLRDADFSKADLAKASLIDDDIGGVIFCTNFKGAKGITTEQIKKAKNWQTACYDPDFRIKFGLPPQNPKCVGDEPSK
jgi:hypothetical protein